jgi:ZIP family zinc transporter
VASAVQHVAAAAIALVPALRRHTPVPTLMGFALGSAAMFALRWMTDHLEQRGRGGAAGLVAATGADFRVDGLVLGAGGAAGGHTGLLLTVAIAIEHLVVGLAVAGTLGPGTSRGHMVLVPVLTTLGAAVGAAVLATVLALGAVAFMYPVTEELLVRAPERGETALGSALFCVRLLLLLVIAELVWMCRVHTLVHVHHAAT